MPSDIIGNYASMWTEDREEFAGWVAERLRGFTYKPGWHFDMTRRPEFPSGVAVQVSFMAEDSRRGPNQVPSYREFTMTAGEPFRVERDDLILVKATFAVPHRRQDEMSFWRWLREVAVRAVELHEADEWFRVNGQLMFDPHVGDL